MNWDDLRLFLAVARERSVSGAGKRLEMHHTGIARRITRFEEELGALLFTRSRSGYTLTPAGEALFERAVLMEEHAIAIHRTMQGLDTSLQGSITLTVNQDVFDILIAPRLAELHERFPQIDLKVLTTPRLLDLDAQEADIALRLTPSPDEHLLGSRIAPLVMGLYTAPSLRVPAPGEEEPAKVILFHRQETLPEWVTQNFPGARVTLRADSLSTVRSAIRGGLGIASLPCFYADSDPTLRRLDRPFDPGGWSLWLLSHADLRSNARVEACRAWLKQILAEQRALLLGQCSRWLET